MTPPVGNGPGVPGHRPAGGRRLFLPGYAEFGDSLGDPLDALGRGHVRRDVDDALADGGAGGPDDPVGGWLQAEDLARKAGLRRTARQVIRYIMRYLGSWWIPFEGGWIRADPALTAMLDAESDRMTVQDAIIARNAAIRAAVSAVQAPGDGAIQEPASPSAAHGSGSRPGSSRSSPGPEDPAG